MGFGEGIAARDGGAPAGPSGASSSSSPSGSFAAVSSSSSSHSAGYPAYASHAGGGGAEGLSARMTAAVKAQPGKAGVLVALLLVLGVVWLKSDDGGRGAPSSASASTAASARGTAPAGAAAGRQGGHAATGGFGAHQGFGGAAGAGPAGAHSPQALARMVREWTSQPLPPPPRNLFAIDLVHFRRDEAALAAAGAAAAAAQPTGTEAESSPAAEGFWEEVEKSLAFRADQERTRSILLENVRRQANRLELQSTVMSGSSPQALVNGTLVREGDAIDGFRVVRIEARRIVVEKEGVRLEVGFKL